MDGKGSLLLTGQLGEVMQESAQLRCSYCPVACHGPWASRTSISESSHPHPTGDARGDPKRMEATRATSSILSLAARSLERAAIYPEEPACGSARRLPIVRRPRRARHLGIHPHPTFILGSATGRSCSTRASSRGVPPVNGRGCIGLPRGRAAQTHAMKDVAGRLRIGHLAVPGDGASS